MNKILNFIFFIIGLIYSCQPEPKGSEFDFTNPKMREETLIASHQAFLKKEREKINLFIDSTGYDFIQTGTGLRYFIYQESNGDSLKKGDIAIVNYQLKDLKGNLLYETEDKLAQEFMVDYDNVESGLHEAIKYLKTGEKAYLVLPAHLAHGITGDQAAIGSQLTLLYDIHVLGKK